MKPLETGSFPLAEIEKGDRLRLVDEDWAQGLADSILETELLNPIQLLRVGDRYQLVAGAHRLRAFEILGRTDIPAMIYEPETSKPELELRLAEIEENLRRRELSVLDRAASIAERQRVLKDLHGETRGRKKPQVGVFSLNEQIREKLNLGKGTVDRAIGIFKHLTGATRSRIAHTWMADHQVQLVALANATKSLPLAEAEETQARVLDLMFCDPPKARSVREAIAIIEKRVIPEKDTREAAEQKIIKIWADLDAAGRRHVLLHLQQMGVRISDDGIKTGSSKKAREG